MRRWVGGERVVMDASCCARRAFEDCKRDKRGKLPEAQDTMLRQHSTRTLSTFLH